MGMFEIDTKKLEEMEEDKENKYNGWLVSNSFLKRALATWGYSTVGSLIVMILFIVLLCFIGILT